MNDLNESALISESTVEIRTKELNLRKKYAFDLKFTYWDADDLNFQMKKEGTSAITIHRAEGDIVVTSDPKFKDPEKFTIRTDQLIEMFVMDVNAVNKMLLIQKEFADVGGVRTMGLTAPGIDAMEKWCKGVDAEIVRIAKELLKKDVKEIFRKIWVEMGGSMTKDHDRVAKRIDYFRKIGEAFRADQEKWSPELRRVGLKK